MPEFIWPKGKKPTEKHKKKISETKKGVPKTDEEKVAIKEGIAKSPKRKKKPGEDKKKG